MNARKAAIGFRRDYYDWQTARDYVLPTELTPFLQVKFGPEMVLTTHRPHLLHLSRWKIKIHSVSEHRQTEILLAEMLL